MEKKIAYNYHWIIKNLLNYLPSRGLVILNAFLIIPIFAHILDKKEMSIYLIAIQILNLILTVSFDGISKAVLRFYEKYKIEDKLDTFVSTILWMSVITYIAIFVIYLLLRDVMLTKYAIDNLTFFLTIILVIPCGIRQFLYQVLRVEDKPETYTWSIVFYQITFIFLFLGITRVFSKAFAVIIAMNIAIFLVDIFVARLLALKYKIEYKLDEKIIGEVLIYVIPLLATNTCYWFILNYSKFVFQNLHQYVNTAIFGVSWMFCNNIIQPLGTLFIFAAFPIIVKKFEHHTLEKTYFTNTIQLYIYLIMPIVSIFCFLSKNVVTLFLPESYIKAWMLLPFFALTVFSHELMKLINIKYHLKNSTYIETALAILCAGLSYFGVLYAIDKWSMVGAVVTLFLGELFLIFGNIMVRIKNIDYINYKKIFKTFTFVMLISIVNILLVSLVFGSNDVFMIILKLITYLTIQYSVSYAYRDFLLK